jgi:hypothetical protein
MPERHGFPGGEPDSDPSFPVDMKSLDAFGCLMPNQQLTPQHKHTY